MTFVQSPDLDSIFPVQNIKARAKSLGFCLCGVTNAESLAQYPYYEDWLTANHHGSMDYLASDRHRRLRRDPKTLVPWVKSIIVFAWPYKLNGTIGAESSGQVAGYVGEKDYHDYIPSSLKILIGELPGLFHREVQSQIFCDSAPILERELAVRAGLGWIGKNSNLINPNFGSAFLLAEVFIDQELPIDLPSTKDLCGKCRKCVEACPTGCILPNRTINANHCISALTIETKGLIPHPMQNGIGNHVFGCDICQTVCPWNRKNLIDEKRFEYSEQEMISSLALDEAAFHAKFRHTAFWRGKREGFIRNLCVVLGNIKSNASQKNIAQIVKTDTNPIICVTAARALMQIDPGMAQSLISDRLSQESNPAILQNLTILIK
jgi:epoxyqueuosine reductase